MAKPEVIDLVSDGIDWGQRQLADHIRMRLREADPVFFQKLDSNDDRIFLEPLLFAYFSSEKSEVGLEQILFGYLSDDLKPKRIRVFADADGVICLPNIGYLMTDTSSRQLALEWNEASRSFNIDDGDGCVNYHFKNIVCVGGTTIEVCQYDHPLLRGFYRDDKGKQVPVDVAKAMPKHIEELNAAVDILRDHYGNYYSAVLKVIRKIVIFNNPNVNSFATVSAHGIAFLSASPDDDAVFFIEDLLHQCGHVIFSAATLQRSDYFAVSPDTPLGRFTQGEEENRTVYVTFHGVFTEAVMNQCLEICYETNLFSGKQRHELLGRFAFILKRFYRDLENLSHEEIFTEKGLRLYAKFAKVFEEIYMRRKNLLSAFDTSNQPYNFSYGKFRKLNPLDKKIGYGHDPTLPKA